MAEPITKEQMLEALGNCWTKEFGELELTVTHCLTEPTCPTAVITTEVEGGPYWRADQDTIEEAISQAVAAAYVTIVQRRPKPMTCPIGDVDEDAKVAKFLAALDARHGSTAA